MKKLLTLLLTLLMVFTLVGCNSKQDTPVVEEPIKQEEEVIEPTESEPILGGWVDIEDGTLTDELKDIFNTALKGLMGASYEPVELVATQVVAGTNYKFLANGTKTTNPITKGTYYITIYKDLEGNAELLDIETIEESQEEVKTQDVTNMSFWVVFYDQYGNELQRTVEKYGTVPEYKGSLPAGFEKWINKNTQKDIDSFKAIIGNTYYQAVCHEVYHSSSSGSNPAPTPTPILKYTVSFDMQNHGTQVEQITNVTSGSKISKPTTPTADGYVFKGWYQEASCEHEWNFTTNTVTANITLYAKWVEGLTINEIINKVENFPTSNNTQSIEAPENAWKTSDGKKCFISNFETSGLVFLNQSYSTGYNITNLKAEKSGDDYIYYSLTQETITFKIENTKLVSITFTGDEKYNGTYVPAIS